jgi:uncharacterized protein
MKLLLLAVVGYVIYFFFFKNGGFSKKIDKEDSETMVECTKCKTYISVSETIIKDGKYYCSEECALLS